MPIYTYKCRKCSHDFEIMQKMSEGNPECPKCRGETRKQLGAPAFKLKGGGWADQGYQKKCDS
jgi:putative FmdB family regulatory protein